MENLQSGVSGVISFRRWSRRSWAVFSSLGRSIRIGVLCLSCSILVLPGYSQEQPDSIPSSSSDREIELEEVVVSAQRSPVVQSQLMRVVQVVTRAEIAQHSSAGLAGLLENLRGVDIRQRGAFGMQADISIRGGTFDQTLILLNGINLTDPQTGHHNLNLPVDLSSVERIEVLQGPGARIFGPNAFNGAINIITAAPATHGITATISGGEFGLFQSSVSAVAALGKVNQHISLGWNRSDGYQENTDFSNLNMYYRAVVPSGPGSFDMQAGYTQRAFGANSFYSPRFPAQAEETRAGFVSVRYKPGRWINLNPAVYWRRHHDRFELFRENAPQWYTGHNYHMTDVAGAAVNWMHVAGYGRLSLGADYRFEHIFSNVLGNPMAVPRSVPGEPGAEFTRSYQRQSLSMMAEQSVFLANFSVSAGLLMHLNASLPNGISIYPGIDLGWQVLKSIRWYATANRTLRLPTFTDLFYNSPTNAGNPDLKPEEALALESGFKLNKAAVNAEISVYRQWGKNMIDWVKPAGNEIWQSLNHTMINVTGIEAGADFDLRQPESLGVFRYIGLHYSWTKADKHSRGFTSLYALDNLKHKVDLSLGHSITSKSGIDWKLSFQDRSGGYQPYVDGAFAEEIPYHPVLLANVKVFWNPGAFQVFAEVSNIMNTKVMDHANVLQPGRWMLAGVKYHLQLK